MGSQSAPYLALTTVAECDRSGYYDTVDSFVTPILAENNLPPLDSSYERKVLKILLKISRSLLRKVSRVAIRKPLFDIPVSDNRLCRPDFIILGQNRKVVLEVMGSWEDEYLERKTRTHPLMEEVGPLVTVDAHLAETKNQWKELEGSLARQLYSHMLADNREEPVEEAAAESESLVA